MIMKKIVCDCLLKKLENIYFGFPFAKRIYEFYCGFSIEKIGDISIPFSL
jgi:hypothetical protein